MYPKLRYPWKKPSVCKNVVTLVLWTSTLLRNNSLLIVYKYYTKKQVIINLREVATLCRTSIQNSRFTILNSKFCWHYILYLYKSSNTLIVYNYIWVPCGATKLYWLVQRSTFLNRRWDPPKSPLNFLLR